jgi:hypothetical protein
MLSNVETKPFLVLNIYPDVDTKITNTAVLHLEK